MFYDYNSFSPPLFLDQTEAWRAEKILLETAPTPPPPLPYPKVWIRHRAPLDFTLSLALFDPSTLLILSWLQTQRNNLFL